MRAQRLLAAGLCLAPVLAWGALCVAPARAAGGAPKAHELRFTGGTIRIVPERAAKNQEPAATLSPASPDWFAAESPAPPSKSPHGRRYLLALSPGGLSPADKESLAAAGAEILDYIPVHGYRLRLPPSAEHAVRAMPFVAWLGEAPAHLKVAPELRRRASLALPAPAGSMTGTTPLMTAPEPESATPAGE